MARFKIEGKLRREFVERVETDLDRDHMVEEVKYLIHELCDEIENILLHVCDELERIDAIRDTLEQLVKDLAD